MLCYMLLYVSLSLSWVLEQPGFIHPGFLNDMSCNPLKKQDKIPRTSLLTSLNLGAISHGLLLIQRWAKTRQFPLPPLICNASFILSRLSKTIIYKVLLWENDLPPEKLPFRNRSFPHQASLGPFHARVASAGMAFINRWVSDKLGRIGFEFQFNFCFNVVTI